MSEETKLTYKRRKYRTINGKKLALKEPDPSTSYKMQKVKSQGTSIEQKLEEIFLEKGIRYTYHDRIIGGMVGKPDFVIPRYKIVVFCDGDFWHGKQFKEDSIKNNTEFWNEKIKSNVERDDKVNAVLTEKGWKVFRFWESDIKKNAEKCVDEIISYIHSQNSQRETPRFTFVDLFSGVGGFRIPLEELGGKCLGYSEINKKSIETYQLNFSDYPQDEETYLGDITQLNQVDVGEIDLVVGGVPCQAWSVAGKMKGFEDPRGKLWEDSIRFIQLNRPKAFIFENVKGLYDPRNKANLDLILERLHAAGYEVAKPQLLNSYDFGVPQNRDRIFIVGFRNDVILKQPFEYPRPLGVKPKLQDILEAIDKETIKKKKLDLDDLHKGKIPLSRNRFQKLDELNDFFVFCDTRNGHSTIHSWDLVRTTQREKEICMAVLRNRRKKKYGPKDGNPLRFEDLAELVPKLKRSELEKLVEKKILRAKEEGYEFVNSKNSSGVNGIYRVYLPNSDIFSTLTATGTKDMIALQGVQGDNVSDYKDNFIRDIYRKKKFRPINSREAGKLQGFPDHFAVHEKEDVAKKQFGNAVSAPVIYHLAKKLLQTGFLGHGS